MTSDRLFRRAVAADEALDAAERAAKPTDDTAVCVGSTVTARDFIPPTLARVVAVERGDAWIRWSNGTSAVVPVADLIIHHETEEAAA